MGCEDFRIRNPNTREMTELGPYLELIPIHDIMVEEVGVEEVDEIEEFLSPEQETIVDMHFKGSPEPAEDAPASKLDEFVEADTEPGEQREEPAPEPEPEPEPEPAPEPAPEPEPEPAPEPEPEPEPEESDEVDED
jgi:outer membrane biosynthesis protein TonB